MESRLRKNSKTKSLPELGLLVHKSNFNPAPATKLANAEVDKACTVVDANAAIEAVENLFVPLSEMDAAKGGSAEAATQLAGGSSQRHSPLHNVGILMFPVFFCVIRVVIGGGAQCSVCDVVVLAVMTFLIASLGNLKCSACEMWHSQPWGKVVCWAHGLVPASKGVPG